MESADLWYRNHLAVFAWLEGARLRCVLLERQVRTRAVVVVEVAAQTTTQVSFVQDDHMVEELAADRTDHALDEGVLPGRARCSEHLGDADALHPSPKLAAVDAVAVAEEQARCRIIGEGLDDLLCRFSPLVLAPRAVRYRTGQSSVPLVPLLVVALGDPERPRRRNLRGDPIAQALLGLVA